MVARCKTSIAIRVCGLGVITHLLVAASAVADPAKYEPGIDPGVGFNLVSWHNFGGSGASVWENAVQTAFDAGFDDISLSPVRFYSPGAGTIAASSGNGPELSHVAAGVARAKQLGMRVTVNPFVEPVGFTTWRGFYDPTPASSEWTSFWNDYNDYLVDVAQMAEAEGADSMTVGTELRAMTRNPGNNSQWNSVISNVDAAFSGTIGYAANWDNYDHANVTATIWEHASIDFMGIDSYFRNLLTNSEADASGDYPNRSFIAAVEDAWNNKLDIEILPFAAARKNGAGMPIEFTEIGYLPRNRTIVMPQDNSEPLDADEQNMVFEGLMRALDGRKAADNFLATHIWQWDMPGSAGSLWNMNPNGGNQPSNQQTALWLSNFVQGTVDPPGATTILYSFEEGLDGFFYPNFESEPASALAHATGTGATHGNASLAITKPTSPWTWDGRVEMSGEALAALQSAAQQGIEDFVLEIDVTYIASDLPTNLTDMNMHVSFQPSPGGWTQAFSFADIDAPVDQIIRAEIPLTAFDNPQHFTPNMTSASFHIGFSGNWTGDATVYIDRIGLRDIKAPSADFNGDDAVDGLDLNQWQGDYGLNDNSDANGDGASNGRDVLIWQQQHSTGASHSVTRVVPEPAAHVAATLLVTLTLLKCGRIFADY